MANDYTDKQYAEHLAQFQKDGTLPEGSIFDPAAERRGKPILRKMTADERKAAGLADAPAKPAAATDDEG